MINIKATNNLSLADCLGGYKSLQDFPTWRFYVYEDNVRCLFIDSIRLSGGVDLLRSEFTITKSGDNFALSISYPTSSGWTTLSDIEFTLSVGGTYQSTDDLANIRIRRLLTGQNGTMSGRILTQYNSPLGGQDSDIADGVLTRYGCLYLELEDETYIDTITSYGMNNGVLDNSMCQVELKTASLNAERIADNETPPTTPSWSNSVSVAASLLAGSYPLWFKIVCPADLGEMEFNIVIDQGSGGNNEVIAISGRCRRFDETLEQYVLYGAYDGSVVDGVEIGSFDTFPAQISLPLPGSGERDYLLRVVKRNKYGIESQNVLLEHAVTVDSNGDDQTIPQTPSNLVLEFIGAGYAQLTYDYVFDTKAPVVYAQIEIGTETTLTQTINSFGTYTFRTVEPVIWGSTIAYKVRFLDNRGNIGDWAQSSVIASFNPLSAPLSADTLVAGLGGLKNYQEYYGGYYDGLAALITEPGRVSFYYDGVLEFYATWNTSNILVLYLGEWRRKNESVSGAQTDVIEDAGSGIVYISDGTTRRIKLDVNNKTFGAVAFKQSILQCRLEDAISNSGSIKYMQAFPTTVNAQQAPEPWIAFEGDAVWMCKYKQTEGT